MCHWNSSRWGFFFTYKIIITCCREEALGFKSGEFAKSCWFLRETHKETEILKETLNKLETRNNNFQKKEKKNQTVTMVNVNFIFNRVNTEEHIQTLNMQCRNNSNKKQALKTNERHISKNAFVTENHVKENAHCIAYW